MLKAVIELSKYILVINIIIYTIISFIVLRTDDSMRKKFPLFTQDILIFINHMVGSLVLLYSRHDMTYLFYPLFQMVAVFSFIVLMRAIYPRSDRLILNHIAMMLSVSFVILTRLSFSRSVRQFVIVALAMIVALIIPALMKYLGLIRKCYWIFALIGIGILGAVLFTGSITNGSKLAFSIMGVSFQPSEFVKIMYVFFIAGLLSKADSLRQIITSGILAAVHVLILVASKDLGSALIYFIVYVVLVFVATKRKRYLILGIAGGAAASYVAYLLFSHVRVRVSAWLDPWSDINSTGYQIAQSLFAIGTGKWFGMGIDSGSPLSIPYVEQDFIFSAICEEYGVIYGIALIAICVNLFLEIVHISNVCEERFLKYSSFGLGVVYISQLFLTIGGNSKFIPLTGVTLPLISYGGSSVLSSMIMFAIIQGLYMNYDIFIADEEIYPARLQMNVIGGVFSFAFIAISAYLVRFVAVDSVQVINNSYNSKRQEIMASQTIRGDILANDGTILATTNQDGEREYPFKEVFSHAIGYAVNGRMGVEQNNNIYLVSSNISLNDKLKDDIDDIKHMGNTVVTTFDPVLQQAAYDALGVYDGAVIVTEPTTGKILAMVSKPDFDPNEISSIWDDVISDNSSSVLLNRTTQGLYPPGSTFKILTALEYIRENPDDYMDYSFDCNGNFSDGDSTIRCYHGTKHGHVDFTKSFAKSCNSSFANISLTLDRSKFADTLDDLYFQKDLPVNFHSKKSSVSIGSDKSDSNMIQTAIGQGSTQMTPLHLAMITAMIANNGEMMVPYDVDHIENAQGETIKQYSPTSLGQLISEDEADALHELMCAVVEEGTGTRLSGQVYDAAGKTGSAEYNSSSDSHAWFTGYTYNTDRPLQITVILEGGGSGGEYAVPVARRILDKYYE